MSLASCTTSLVSVYVNLSKNSFLSADATFSAKADAKVSTFFQTRKSFEKKFSKIIKKITFTVLRKQLHIII
jgi:hypothetical protein